MPAFCAVPVLLLVLVIVPIALLLVWAALAAAHAAAATHHPQHAEALWVPRQHQGSHGSAAGVKGLPAVGLNAVVEWVAETAVAILEVLVPEQYTLQHMLCVGAYRARGHGGAL